MKTLRTLQELSHWLAEHPQPALVPTMGALHAGHLALIQAAQAIGQPVLVSIFVNPAQFGPDEDFADYPRDTEGDLAKLEAAAVDAAFLPHMAEMYPGNRKPKLPVLPEVFSELEGEVRPGHFAGVAQAVFRLFQLIRPQVAFFGQKDFQQTVLVRWLVRSCGFETQIEVVPTVRETSGLALSSRNAYLSEQERIAAASLYQALQAGQRRYAVGERNAEHLIRTVQQQLEAEPAFESIDYVDIRGPHFFDKVHWVAKPSVLVAAVRMGKVRLIDNVIVG